VVAVAVEVIKGLEAPGVLAVLVLVALVVGLLLQIM
jgi:hypothetical protein